MFTVSVALLAVVVGTLLPILVGLVTKQVASQTLKAVLLAGLAAITGLANGALNMGGVFTQEALVAAGVTWVTAVATYYGFLKPTNISGAVNSKTAKFGVGGRSGGGGDVAAADG